MIPVSAFLPFLDLKLNAGINLTYHKKTYNKKIF
jgi:hypothetical protein